MNILIKNRKENKKRRNGRWKGKDEDGKIREGESFEMGKKVKEKLWLCDGRDRSDKVFWGETKRKREKRGRENGMGLEEEVNYVKEKYWL